MFKITSRLVKGVVALELHGRMTEKEHGLLFEAEIQRHFTSGRIRFVVNLQDLSYLSGGNYGVLGYFISQFTKLKKVKGDLLLACMQKKVHDIFQITKLYTVFGIYSDEESAVSAFLGGKSRRQFNFAIVPDRDGRLRLEILEKLVTTEVAETADSPTALTTIWLPAASIFSREEIDLFEKLINAIPPATESAFQNFFETHQQWLFLLGEQYEAAVPHTKIPPLDLNASLAFSPSSADGMTLIPDFLLKRVGLDLWDVLDIKLPTAKTIVGRPSRRRFSQEVADSVAQLREYNRRLRNPEIRKLLWNEHGIKVAEPVPMVLVGCDFDFDGSQEEKDRFRESEGVRVYTYDDLHRLAKRRRIETNQ